jgi:hexokinase
MLQKLAKITLLTKKKKQVPMLCSYIHDFPKGREEGIFYTIDLGGSNLRILRVELKRRLKKGADGVTSDKSYVSSAFKR